jgi:hypothetical protein
MASNSEKYAMYVDDTGEGYYCPIDALAEDSQMSEKGLSDCVEVSTVRRYSGNLNLTDL